MSTLVHPCDCNWSDKFKLKIDRSVITPWQEYGVVAGSLWWLLSVPVAVVVVIIFSVSEKKLSCQLLSHWKTVTPNNLHDHRSLVDHLRKSYSLIDNMIIRKSSTQVSSRLYTKKKPVLIIFIVFSLENAELEFDTSRNYRIIYYVW